MANEKRLIDANAFRKNIDCCDFDTYTDKQTVCDQINDAPTVDAVEVVHGRWQERRFICMDSEVMLGYRCSECNLTFDSQSNYCSNCGAKMDGERREGE